MKRQKSKILHFDGLLLSKSRTVPAEKYIRVLMTLTLKSDTKFKEKLTSRFKDDIKNLVNFHPITHKSKNFSSTGFFYPKYKEKQIEKYRGVIFHDTERHFQCSKI